MIDAPPPQNGYVTLSYTGGRSTQEDGCNSVYLLAYPYILAGGLRWETAAVKGGVISWE
jgi:hypothetical protein